MKDGAKMKRRDEKTMLKLILEIAQQDSRIMCVMMNGSRTLTSSKQDVFQDYDIIYGVSEVTSFVTDKKWHQQFGKLLIMQTPMLMNGDWGKDKTSYNYLMQFTDWNRIDLTLIEQAKLIYMPKDSQSRLLLDKTGRMGIFPQASEQDYLPTPPTQKQFEDCCNEFYWVATYVAKGIWRKELTYAKYMAENIVRQELIKLMIWHAGIKTNFRVNMGMCGKNLQQHTDVETWQRFSATYVDDKDTHMWAGLMGMCELFRDIAMKVSKQTNYDYPDMEYQNVVKYIVEVKGYK